MCARTVSSVICLTSDRACALSITPCFRVVDAVRPMNKVYELCLLSVMAFVYIDDKYWK